MSEQITEQSPIYIIGDTPLAYFLTAKLFLAGETSFLLGEHNILKSVDTFTLKDVTRAKKSSIRTLHASVMHDSARMVILCMDSNKIKSGLIHISAAKTRQAPIISFCHTNNLQIFDEIVKQSVIPAYFDGWLSLSAEDKLSYFGSPMGFRISCNNKHPHFNLLQNIFSKTEIETEFNGKDTQNFWDYFIPYAACSFFALKNNSHFREIAQKTNYRQDLSTILDEIISAAPTNIKIAKEKIINNIYLTPQNYIYPAADEQQKNAVSEFSFICETLQKSENFKPSRLPVITEIIKTKSHLLLSSVEKKEFTLNNLK